MINSKKTEIISIICIALATVLAVILLIAANKDKETITDSINNDVLPGISTEYTDKIFDDSYVHTINVEIKDSYWSYMIEHATEETYMICDVVVDGERFKDVAFRPKGNSSLSSIAAQGDNHFSFKLEFDHYQTGYTYHGLDKLSLNNLGQDKSCMKDYIAYHMMNEAGIPAPLSSYTLLQINGEDLGLYLAVEAIDDSFCYRNYGEEYGELYRPDAFDIDSIQPTDFINLDYEALFGNVANAQPGQRVDILGSIINVAFLDVQDQVSISAINYVGDDIDDYNIVFDTSVFDINKADKKRYVDAVKTLNTTDNPADALEIDTVIRYFAIHNFINNYDSYTGVFVHNFYVHEKDGKLSMVPWDYNLGFGAFSVESAAESFFGGSAYNEPLDLGQALSDEASFVNYPIDTPTYVVAVDDRPMFGTWINIPEYREQYHDFYVTFINDYFTSGKYASEYAKIYNQIRPYVEKGLTFYTLDEYEKGAANFNLYNELRSESILKQVAGEIPTTIEGQEADYDSLIDTADLNLGTTISFEGVAFGITSADVQTIMDAVAGDEHSHDAAGITEVLTELQTDTSGIPSILGRILGSSTILQKMLLRAILPGLTFLICVVILIVAIKLVKKNK